MAVVRLARGFPVMSSSNKTLTATQSLFTVDIAVTSKQVMFAHRVQVALKGFGIAMVWVVRGSRAVYSVQRGQTAMKLSLCFKMFFRQFTVDIAVTSKQVMFSNRTHIAVNVCGIAMVWVVRAQVQFIAPTKARKLN